MACVRTLVHVGLLSLLTLTACADFDRFHVVPRDASQDAVADAETIDGETDEGDGGGVTCTPACSELEFCADAGVCEPRRPNAGDCARGAECLSGFCDPDGICCAPGLDCCDTDAECAGQYRCDVAARKCFATCTEGTELSACKASGHCSAASNCVDDLAAGAANACTRSTMCVGDVGCVDGFCCNGPCAGCSRCDAPGSLGVCALVPSGEDPHGACTPSGCTNDGTCNGMGGCRTVGAGSDPNDACTPSACTNDGTCDGAGACRRVAAGADPNNVCAGTSGSCNTGSCNGAGRCTPLADGTTCTGAAVPCGAHRCDDGVCLDFCTWSGQPVCEYCPGDDANVCGGC